MPRLSSDRPGHQGRERIDLDRSLLIFSHPNSPNKPTALNAPSYPQPTRSILSLADSVTLIHGDWPFSRQLRVTHCLTLAQTTHNKVWLHEPASCPQSTQFEWSRSERFHKPTRVIRGQKKPVSVKKTPRDLAINRAKFEFTR